MKATVFSLAVSLLALSPSVLAAPTPTPADDVPGFPAVEYDAVTSPEADSTAGKTPNVSVQNAGSPKCKTTALYDLCTSSNANAYCDVTGFHNNFMSLCGKNCWCD